MVLSTAEMRAAAADVGTATGLLLWFGYLGGIVLALLVQVTVAHPLVAVAILAAAVVLAAPLAGRFPAARRGG
ncbi:MAG: hypothetical protein K6T78_11635 [Alicyclobacillus sp.]|nr:hypothetical protein [Alicyclobacillus sp.]